MLNIKKTNAPILIKFSDGRTEEQTDESDFIGRCRTNVECPINNTSTKGMTTITIMATHPRLPSLQNLIFAVLHGLHQGWLPWYRTSRNMIAVFRCTLRLCTSVKVLRQSKHKNYQIPNQTRILLQNWQLRRVFLMDSLVHIKQTTWENGNFLYV